MPFSQLLMSTESLHLLREAEEEAERVANDKKEKKEAAIQKRVAQEMEKEQKQEIRKQKKEEKERMKLEQQRIREEKRLEKKKVKKGGTT